MNKTHYQYLILGAGPAGLQTAYYFQKSRKDYLVLERSSGVAPSFEKFPRHGRLLSINKVSTGFKDPEINLRWDWNSLLCEDESFRFTNYSRKYFPPSEDLVRYLHDFYRTYDLNVRFNSPVVCIEKKGVFLLRTAEGCELSCDYLIVATGLSQENVFSSRYDFIETYGTASTDPEDYRDQRVLILGKGNSAFETADNLVETASVIHLLSPNPVMMAWKTHYVGHLRAINNSILDTYQLKSQNTIIDARIDSIEKSGGSYQVNFTYSHARGQTWQIQVDRIISCLGFSFDDSLFSESCKPELCPRGKYPAMTSCWESVNVKGLYFSGTLMHMRDYRKSFSGFIHGFRYNIKALCGILDKKHHDIPIPVRTLNQEPVAFTDSLLQRIHQTSSLFQQPGFIIDYFEQKSSGEDFLWYQDIPLDYLKDLNVDRPCLVLSMEYGHDEHPDPFHVERFADDGKKSTFIHPVLRLMLGKKVVDEYHVPEDLENNWNKSMYTEPLLEFVRPTLYRIRAYSTEFQNAPEMSLRGDREPFSWRNSYETS